uniref:Beta-glucosidase n=1 Tax=Caenorhabditis japonica TaxID=281687 RepID=A0A8R1DFM0_CAEJA
MSLPSKFPKTFKFATATAAYQIEGATRLDGRGISTWDEIRAEPGRIHDNSPADLSCEGRLKYKEDVDLLARIGVTSYRFSISWSRILPDGTLSKINEDGVQFYRDLCLLLRDNGIEPIVTLFHFDMPLAIYDNGTSWLNRENCDHFAAFANLCFERFGDLVKTWITFNEINMHAWSSVVKIEGELWLCPDRPQVENHSHAPYIAATNMLLTHAKIYQDYNKNFKEQQNGVAANRANDWLFNYTIEPILSESGDFPVSMREKLPFLPKFSEEEKKLIRDSADFIGINYYLSHMVRNISDGEVPTSQHERDASYAFVEGKWDKICGETWVRYAPDGLHELLKYVKQKYNNIPVFITENGCMDLIGDDEKKEEEDVLEDKHRIKYIAGHLEALAKALEEGCNVIGYTVWTLMDNFEWDDGFAVKFGICRVDFDSPDKTRTMKHSAKYYQTFIREFKKHHNIL